MLINGAFRHQLIEAAHGVHVAFERSAGGLDDGRALLHHSVVSSLLIRRQFGGRGVHLHVFAEVDQHLAVGLALRAGGGDHTRQVTHLNPVAHERRLAHVGGGELLLHVGRHAGEFGERGLLGGDERRHFFGVGQQLAAYGAAGFLCTLLKLRAALFEGLDD